MGITLSYKLFDLLFNINIYFL